MKSTQYSLETFLYIHSNDDLIRIAGQILGSQKLRLSLEEAVSVIRNNWN